MEQSSVVAGRASIDLPKTNAWLHMLRVCMYAYMCVCVYACLHVFITVHLIEIHQNKQIEKNEIRFCRKLNGNGCFHPLSIITQFNNKDWTAKGLEVVL